MLLARAAPLRTALRKVTEDGLTPDDAGRPLRGDSGHL